MSEKKQGYKIKIFQARWVIFVSLAVVMVGTMYLLLKHMSGRMGRLLSAIEAVSEGNLNVEIDTERGRSTDRFMNSLTAW